MWYQKVHYRHRHSFGWVPLVLFALFFFWGGWKLLFLLPMILLPLAAIWFFVPSARRWKSDYRRGDWGNWNDWSGRGFDSDKRKNDWDEGDEAETGSKYMYEPPKRKNDDDVYYV
jgi:hypothetical protein